MGLQKCAYGVVEAYPSGLISTTSKKTYGHPDIPQQKVNNVSEHPSARPQLLIAMVSRDVIVLAKLLRTLCPRHVLLFCTDYARNRGWLEPSQRLLDGLVQNRPEIVGTFNVVTLPDTELPERLDAFCKTIASVCGKIEESTSKAVFDFTTGQGIFHVLGFDSLRRIKGMNVSAAYCDGDTGQILLCSPRGDDFDYMQRPIDFRYRPEHELQERFAIYGVTPNGGERLWPCAAPISDQSPLCQLYDALCENEALRALFHSGWLKIKRWQRLRHIQADVANDTVDNFIRERIANLANKIDGPSSRETRIAIIKKTLENVFSPYYGDTTTWLDRYAEDRSLSELNKRLTRATSSLARILLSEQSSLELLPRLERQFKKQRTDFMIELRATLNGISLTQGRDSAMFTAAEHRDFIAHELEDIGVPEAVKVLLLAPGQKLPDLFESCIGHAVARLAERQYNASVATVIQNITFLQENRAVSELGRVNTIADIISP